MAKELKKIQDTEGGRFGEYSEDTGGGEPMGPGTKHPIGGRGTWDANYDRKPKRTSGQPRTDDGKFTYNSVNGKKTKYPGRGKTVNPVLVGGQNGIKIKDVEREFNNKKGYYWDKYKDSWYQEGSESLRFYAASHKKADWHTNVAGRPIWDIAKWSYDEVHGEFTDETANWQGKSGSRGKEEKAALAEASASGKDTFVENPITKAIKRYKKKQAQAPATTTAAPTSAAAPTTSPVAPTTGTTTEQPTATVGTSSKVANADYTPKYTDDDIKEFKNALIQMGAVQKDIDGFMAMSPKEKDDFIDELIATDEDESNSPVVKKLLD